MADAPSQWRMVRGRADRPSHHGRESSSRQRGQGAAGSAARVLVFQAFSSSAGVGGGPANSPKNTDSTESRTRAREGNDAGGIAGSAGAHVRLHGRNERARPQQIPVAARVF